MNFAKIISSIQKYCTKNNVIIDNFFATHYRQNQRIFGCHHVNEIVILIENRKNNSYLYSVIPDNSSYMYPDSLKRIYLLKLIRAEILNELIY